MKGVQLDLEAKRIISREDLKPFRFHRISSSPEEGRRTVNDRADDRAEVTTRRSESDDETQDRHT